MNDDRFFARLRNDARVLRYEGGMAARARIRAGVNDRIRSRETLTGVFAAWLRPVGAGFVAVALIATVTFVWMQQPVAGDLFANAEVAPLSEDYYRVAD